MDRFRQILYDLGKELKLDLYPDNHQVCQLNFNEQLHIQIQYDERKQQILLATFLCDVPPGKYREKLFAESLNNNNECPRVGTLAYSQRNNKLTLFEYIPAAGLSGQNLFKILKIFIQKGLQWKEAVEKGQPLPGPAKPSSEQGMFGLKL